MINMLQKKQPTDEITSLRHEIDLLDEEINLYTAYTRDAKVLRKEKMERMLKLKQTPVVVGS